MTERTRRWGRGPDGNPIEIADVIEEVENELSEGLDSDEVHHSSESSDSASDESSSSENPLRGTNVEGDFTIEGDVNVGEGSRAPENSRNDSEHNDSNNSEHNDSGEGSSDTAEDRETSREMLREQIGTLRDNLNNDLETIDHKAAPSAVIMFSKPWIILIFGLAEYFISLGLGVSSQIAFWFPLITWTIVWFMVDWRAYNIILRAFPYIALNTILSYYNANFWGIQIIASLLPELLAMALINPSAGVQSGWEQAKEAQKTAAKEKFQKAVAKLEGDQSLTQQKKWGKHKLGLYSSQRKVFSMLLIFIILGLGPIGIGYLTFTRASITLYVLIIIILILLYLFGFLDKRETSGVFIAILLSSFADYVLYAVGSLISTTFVQPVIIMFIYFSVSAIALGVILGYLNSSTAMGLIILIILLLSIFYFHTYLTSDYFSDQMNLRQAQLEAKKGNWVDQFLTFIDYQKKLARGEIVEGAIQEHTHQFIGVDITGWGPTSDEFEKGKEIRSQIFYKTGSYIPITLWTACKIDKIQGKVNKNNIILDAGANEVSVNCVIPGEALNVGANAIDYISVYTFKSTVEFPIKIMDKNQAELLRNSRYDSNKIDLEEYVGGTLPARTDAGPVVIGISNKREANRPILEMPLLLNETGGLDTITIQLQPYKSLFSEDVLDEKVAVINAVEINAPIGMHFRCSFFQNQEYEIPMKVVDGRNYALISGNDLVEETYTTMVCDINVDKDKKEIFAPPKYFSTNTIIFSFEYQYVMKNTEVVNIKVRR